MILHTEAIKILLSILLIICLGVAGPIVVEAVSGKRTNMETRIGVGGVCITVLIWYLWLYSYGLLLLNVR